MVRGYIQIRPLDGLFFGKGRPFSMGDDSWTEAELLPPPGVVWGALASQLFYTNGGQAPKPDAFKIGPIMLLGEKNDFSSLQVPAPLDIFMAEDASKYHHAFYWQRDDINNREELPKFITHQDSNVLLRPLVDKEVELPEYQLISWGDLYGAYTSETAKKNFYLSLFSLENHLSLEQKTGIQRSEDTRSVEEGKLFTVQLAHLKPGMSFLVPYENRTGTMLPENGILKLGGEGKLAAYRHLPDKNLIIDEINRCKHSLTSDEATYRFFKLVALMPIPLNPNGHLPLPSNSGFQVLGGVTGKSIQLGGFDYDKWRPKPLQDYAPAGSVWVLGAINASSIKSAREKLVALAEPGRFDSFELFPYTSIQVKA